MKFVNGFVSLGGTDISGFLESIDLDVQKETDADARMGDNTAKVVATRDNWTVSLAGIQDYTASVGLDAVIWPLFAAGDPVAIVVRPTAGAASTGNPEYTGQVVLTNYKPIAGTHGRQARTPITCAPAGDLSRGTGS